MKKHIKIGIAVALIVSLVPTVSVNQEKVIALGARPDSLISTQGHYSMVVERNGTLAAWGSNNLGMIGNGVFGTIEKEKVPVENTIGMVEVDANTQSLIMVKKDGTVWSWGNAYHGNGAIATSSENRPVQVRESAGGNFLENVVDVAQGERTGASNLKMVVKKDGTVWAWGQTSNNFFGDGATEKLYPTKINGLDKVVKADLGIAHATFIKSDGTVWTMGIDSSGQLGNGVTVGPITPIEVQGILNVVDIKSEGNRTMVLKGDGTVWAWGENSVGQLGLGNATTTHVPTQVPGVSNVVKIKTGYRSTFAITTSGELYSWGLNTAGQLGLNTKVNTNTPTKNTLLKGVVDIGAGYSHATALLANGTIWGWGLNDLSQLGFYQSAEILLPIELFLREEKMLNAEALDASSSHVVVVKTDGTLWSWGSNSVGKLGVGVSGSYIQDRAKKVNIEGVIKAKVGTNNTLALKSDGTVWGWGNNSSGEVGDNSATGFHNQPVASVLPATMVDIEAGGTHAFAIDNTGQLWGWGESGSKQVLNSTTDVKLPTMIPGMTNVKKVENGTDYTIALKQDGTVWGWGSGLAGKLGRGSDTAYPSQVTTTTDATIDLQNIVDISVGTDSAFAVDANGSVWGWGSKQGGKLGEGSTSGTTAFAVPIIFPEPIESIDASNSYTLAKAKSGVYYSFGRNTEGQLMNGTVLTQTTPALATMIGQGKGTTQAGSNSAYLIDESDGSVLAVGTNTNALLADRTVVNRYDKLDFILQEPVVLPVPPDVVPPTIKITKNIIEGESSGTLVLTENNSEAGPNRRLKYASAAQEMGYFDGNGISMAFNEITITKNGVYTFYLMDNRGYETKEQITVTELVENIVPELLTQSEEFLIPYIAPEEATFKVQYNHQATNSEVQLIALADGVESRSYVGEAETGDALEKEFYLSLEDYLGQANRINERIPVELLLETETGIRSESQTNTMEIYDPLLEMESSFNSIEINWEPSTLTDVEYSLRRNGIEISRGPNISFSDMNQPMGQMNTYTLDALHKGNTYRVFSGTKKVGELLFEHFGDISMETKQISIGALAKASTMENQKASLIQSADIKESFEVKMTLTPFESLAGSYIAADNFKIKNATLNKKTGEIIKNKDFNFVDNIPTTLITNIESTNNQEIELLISPENIELALPDQLRLNQTNQEQFISIVTYQLEMSP